MAMRKSFSFHPILPVGLLAALALCGGIGLKAVWEELEPSAMESPRLMSGVWIDRFEGQSFMEGATAWVDPEQCGTGTWINIDHPTVEKIHKETLRPDEHGPFVYRISFVGQRTRRAGDYGHMGMSSHLVQVSEVRSITRLRPPPHRSLAQVQSPCKS